MTSPLLPLPIGIRIAGSPDLARPAAVEMASRAAEALGYAAAWVVGDDPEELLAVAATAAAATEQIRIGVGLLVGPHGLRPDQRDALPALHDVAPGRLTLGLVVATEPAADGAQAAHVLDTVRSADPARSRHDRVVLSARSREAMAVIAARADGWLADGVPVAELPERWAELRALAARHGRADDLALVVAAWIDVVEPPSPDPRIDYQGDVSQVADDVLLAALAGAEEVVLIPVGSPTLDELLDVCARVGEALEVALRAAPGAVTTPD